MKLLKSFLSKKYKNLEYSTPSDEFNSSKCRCIQQELNLSDSAWMDKTSYNKAREGLKVASRNTIIARYKLDKQRDLFGIFSNYQ